VSIYKAPEYPKSVIFWDLAKNREMKEEKMDTRKETIAKMREILAAMTAKEKVGIKPATIEKHLTAIERQIDERA
jgi:hypothetical protein